jgi:tRNA(Glu) U13 pseudouridine synthase TruD
MRRRLVDDGTLALVHGNHSNSLFQLPGAYRHILSQVKNLRYRVEDMWGNWSTVIYDADESSLFAKEVETKWRNQMIPSLLDRIYPTDTSPYLSRSLLEDITADASSSGRTYFDEDGAIRLAFSLCSSSYATTYLDWLLMP